MPTDDGRRWTLQRILDALTELHHQGVAITYRGLAAAGHRKLANAVNHFGGVRRVRKLAGLPVPRRPWRRLSFDAPGVLAEIHRRHQEGEPLAWSRIPDVLQSAGQRHFGSWRAAILAAGLDYEGIRLNREYSETQLLEALRGLARQRPEMTLSELRREPIATPLSARFGSLTNAIRRAGFDAWPARPAK
jgi:hypothetical protein